MHTRTCILHRMRRCFDLKNVQNARDPKARLSHHWTHPRRYGCAPGRPARGPRARLTRHASLPVPCLEQVDFTLAKIRLMLGLC